MEHEGIGMGTELGNDEGRLVRHQTGNEMNVTTQPIELGNDDRGFEATGVFKAGAN